MEHIEAELNKLSSQLKRNLDAAEQVYSAYCNANTYSTEFVQEKLRQIAQEIESIEYQIQEVKGEPKDRTKHLFWFQIAGCKCPSDINNNCKHRVIAEDCLIHGKDLK